MIHRQMFMVGGKKRRRGGGRERSEKDTLTFLLPDRRAPLTSSFFRVSSFQPHSPVRISSVIYIVYICHYFTRNQYTKSKMLYKCLKTEKKPIQNYIIIH
ncbi:hypothetical protein [Aneurinibacillus migulanus]|uniref:hypothetical protein n=1 Tax=Aneurinibacillus migulanus TaxID=47500 RepID=UPI001F1DFFF7|nr:hypothetical protein [Aneurinibacillus migulanus]